jgi:hypothetical protein
VIDSPEAALERVLPRWHRALPAGATAAQADAFVDRHRVTILELIARALTTLDGRTIDFAALDLLVPPNRRRDEAPDDAVVQRVLRRVDAVLAQGYGQLGVFQNQGREYVDARGEAILVRKEGWDAVPLLLTLPALVIVIGGHVAAVRDSMGTLHIHPSRAGMLNHLFGAISRVEARVVELGDEIGIDPNNHARLVRYATRLWERARADGSPSALETRTS